MSLVRLFKEKKTPEEIQQAREARKNVYAYITGATANLVNAVKANTITPETSKECSSLLTAEKKWLDGNTDADTQDIVSRYDVLNDKIKTLIENDKPRLIFKNSLLVYDTVFKASLQQGKITKEQYEQEQIAKEEAKAQAAKIVADAQVTINHQKMAAITDLKNQVGTLVIEVSEKILRRELSNKAEQELYIKQLASEAKLN
jgi:hypothetical protein